jgi:hypothetical protein
MWRELFKDGDFTHFFKGRLSLKNIFTHRHFYPSPLINRYKGKIMEYGNLLDDALHYTKEGIFGRADRWMKLSLAII